METIHAASIVDMSKKINIEASKLSRLFTRYYSCVSDRYVLDQKYCFILEEVETGREFLCVKPKTFFLHLKKPYEDNLGKYMHCLLKGRQKTFSYCGLTYRIKRQAEPFEKRRKIFPKDCQRITCERRIKSNKIKKNLRTRLGNALLRRRNKKKSTTLDYLGCSIDYFMGWIEAQFLDGMNWDNHGEWHIDHIKPCNTFDFNKEEDIYKCFHYLNMRPLWAVDNLKRPKDGSDL
jgi:hypothetical protein